MLSCSLFFLLFFTCNRAWKSVLKHWLASRLLCRWGTKEVVRSSCVKHVILATLYWNSSRLGLMWPLPACSIASHARHHVPHTPLQALTFKGRSSRLLWLRSFIFIIHMNSWVFRWTCCCMTANLLNYIYNLDELRNLWLAQAHTYMLSIRYMNCK